MLSEAVAKTASYSVAGAKAINEDNCNAVIPDGVLFRTKGVAAAVADGISGSDAGREASAACVEGFLSDYFSTPESWTVKTSAAKVLAALNRWLYGQGHRLYGSDRAMLTTLSAVVIKSGTAHLFHVGDTRIYYLHGDEFSCLTQDHRLRLEDGRSYLGRAMGADLHVEIDYRTITVQPGDRFLLTTDGVHDFLGDNRIRARLVSQDSSLDTITQKLVEEAIDAGSLDNLTALILQIEATAEDDESFYRQLTELPFPPPLEPGMTLDGYRVLREIHASKRTQVYLALDSESSRKVILKTPSPNYDDDPVYIDRFLHEEWAGRRINNPHVLAVLEPRQRQCLYYVTEYIEGQTLRQWMQDHKLPGLHEVRGMISQIAVGLRAFHRMEMVHQDLKPENIVIDDHGTLKIIDFGSVKIAGIEEIAAPIDRQVLLGTRNYTAPELLQGLPAGPGSDQYALAVIAYELLTGRLPYGRDRSLRQLLGSSYTPAGSYNPEVPAWMDAALQKALHRNPSQRYEALSEFIHDLNQPGSGITSGDFVPFIDRNPLGFWRTLALLLLLGHLLWFVLVFG